MFLQCQCQDLYIASAGDHVFVTDVILSPGSVIMFLAHPAASAGVYTYVLTHNCCLFGCIAVVSVTAIVIDPVGRCVSC